MDVRQTILREKVIVIVRGIYERDLLDLALAMREGGLHAIELTFDQSAPDRIVKTTDAIRMLNAAFGNDMCIGAGTVLSALEAGQAHEAGARFIISPNTDPAVIAYTKANGMVSIPGAMTPTEMVAADASGADFIKVFPADVLGFGFFKSIRAPLNHLRFIAAGGVTSDNFLDYLDAGYTGAGVSSYLANKTLIQERNFEALAGRARALRVIADNTK